MIRLLILMKEALSVRNGPVAKALSDKSYQMEVYMGVEALPVILLDLRLSSIY